MPPPLILRIIGDATSYFKTADATIATNTKLAASFGEVGKASQLSADAEIAAGTKAIAAQRARVDALTAANAKLAVGSDAAAAGNVALLDAQSKLNRQLGISTIGARGMGTASKEAERDLGKFTRGALAGTGVASSLGRSLAFASTGFIAIAGGATLLTSSIKAALTLAATQRQVEAQLKTSGKTWGTYGERVDAADLKLSHVSGFTNQELLQSFGYLVRVTGNVSTSLRLNAVAADVARGRHIALSSASLALAKALGGSNTALRRLGIIIPTNLKGMEALNYVSAKFAGQAQAGATVADRFHASLVNTEEIIGTALLPTFERLTTRLGNWLSKMNETGRLQRDVNEAVRIGGDVFHTLGGAISVVDKITGSFANTLKLAFEIFAGREILRALIGLDSLAAKWLGVAGAANVAASAEERATALAAGAGVGGAGAVGIRAGAAEAGSAGLLGGLAARRAAQQAARSATLRSNVSAYLPQGEAMAAEEGVAAIGGAAVASTGKVAVLRGALSGLGALAIAPIAIPIVLNIENRIKGPITTGLDSLFGRGQASQILKDLIVPTSAKDFLGVNLFKDVFQYKSSADKAAAAVAEFVQNTIIARLQKKNFGPPAAFQPAGSLGRAVANPAGTSAANQGHPFGTARPITVWASYQLTIAEQIAQVQAALTKTTADDVAVAKGIIARIKSVIDKGHLAGNSLIQALQDEASAQGVIDSARQAAAQKAAQIAAAAQAAASSYTTPIDIQLAQARAELTASSRDDIAAAKAAFSAAKAAIASGRKNKEGQLAAIQAEIQAKQTLDSLRSQSSTTFTQPLRLQLALAKAQATGANQTPILEKMKAALERALKAAKGNIQKQIDIWNQIAAINSQLGSTGGSALGGFKQASTRALTAGLNLTAEQRKALRARLSQLGPGGTVPGSGVGAGGYVIDPKTGRPVGAGRVRSGRRGSPTGPVGGRPSPFNPTFDFNIYIDGRQVEATVTRRQQKRRSHNPSQRRGPNAGMAGA